MPSCVEKGGPQSERERETQREGERVSESAREDRWDVRTGMGWDGTDRSSWQEEILYLFSFPTPCEM